MEQVFKMKVKDKIQELKDFKAKIMYDVQTKNLKAQHKELEQKHPHSEDEKANKEFNDIFKNNRVLQELLERIQRKQASTKHNIYRYVSLHSSLSWIYLTNLQ